MGPDEGGNCGNCKHWIPQDSDFPKGGGICQNPKMQGRLNLSKEQIEDVVFCSYLEDGRFWTDSCFWCVCHEVKETITGLRLRPGWIAVDLYGDWYWYRDRPYIAGNGWMTDGPEALLEGPFSFPSCNWKESLRRVVRED